MLHFVVFLKFTVRKKDRKQEANSAEDEEQACEESSKIRESRDQNDTSDNFDDGKL
eukprot:JP440239.1.p2 GENE.JP440239.1~~JP440239.1.p2  ORF type:complete len:56 (-),score=0.38 JP440239.1:27-194(-)